jgi:hypothetical protein
MRRRRAIHRRNQRRSSQTEESFNAAFYEPHGQFDNGAQAQYEAQANVQSSRTEDADERVQTHEMARASDHNILTDNGDNEAQVQADPAKIPAPLAERERPILTQQKVMDLIMQRQVLPNNTVGNLMAASWATKKQDFSDMLSGFRSPTGTTYRVALDLASVLFVSVAAADANRMSLMAQNEEQQKLVAQAGKHRETLEKEFTLNLERIRAENQKSLDQTIRIREELMKSCQPINNAGMLERIEGNQGAEIVKFQLKLMQAQKDRLELELQNNMERHESDMLKVLEDNKKKEKDLERERFRNKLLEKDLKQCEDCSLGTGMTRPPREEPELEQKIKVEEPIRVEEIQERHVKREKTRQENIERDDKLAREEENLARKRRSRKRKRKTHKRERNSRKRKRNPRKRHYTRKGKESHSGHLDRYYTRKGIGSLSSLHVSLHSVGAP